MGIAETSALHACFFTLQVLRGLGEVSADALNKWRQCWSDSPAEGLLAIPEQEAALAAGAVDAQAQILFDPTIRINNHQYRGSLSKVLPLPPASRLFSAKILGYQVTDNTLNTRFTAGGCAVNACKSMTALHNQRCTGEKQVHQAAQRNEPLSLQVHHNNKSIMSLMPLTE
jgi:hypothetical protein